MLFGIIIGMQIGWIGAINYIEKNYIEKNYNIEITMQPEDINPMNDSYYPSYASTPSSE